MPDPDTPVYQYSFNYLTRSNKAEEEVAYLDPGTGRISPYRDVGGGVNSENC